MIPLYHFTTRRKIASIKDRGLLLGIVPMSLDDKNKIVFATGLQWLTSNANWDQEWCSGKDPRNKLRPERTEIRITITIPKRYFDRLARWSNFATFHKVPFAGTFEQMGDAQNWYVYSGIIPPSWFLTVEENPALALSATGSLRSDLAPVGRKKILLPNRMRLQ